MFEGLLLTQTTSFCWPPLPMLCSPCYNVVKSTGMPRSMMCSSKCIIISWPLQLATELILWATSLIISGNIIENIDSLPQLSYNGSDELDVMSHRKLVKSIMWSVGFCLYKNETWDALLRHWQSANYWFIQKPGILTLISVDCIEHAIICNYFIA